MQALKIKATVVGPIVEDQPVGKPTNDTEAANAIAYAQAGEALAERIIADCDAQALKGKRFLRAIFDLTPEGRTAMRSTLSERLYNLRDELRQAEGTPIATLLASKVGSMAAQTSGYSRFSQACDAGFEVSDWEALDYHEQLAEARAFLNSGAALAEGKTGDEVAFVKTDAEGNPVAPVGPTRLRGRPAKSKAEKFVAYVEKLEPSVEDMLEFVKILRASIKAAKDEQAEQATAALAGAPAAPAHVPMQEDQLAA